MIIYLKNVKKNIVWTAGVVLNKESDHRPRNLLQGPFQL